MSRFLRAAAVGLVLAAGTVATAPAQQAQPAMQAVDAAADPILAIVDGAAIRRSDLQTLQRALPAQFQQMPLEMLFPLLIDRMIDAKLLAIAGRKDEIHNDPDIRARVASFEERLVQDAYLTRRVAAATTEEAIQARYRKFVAENPAETEISARHILVASEQKAREILAALSRGGDFAKLAADNSIDPSGKDNGGDLGFFRKADMVPEFSEAAFALKEGQTADRPVKSQFGWHVIRVDKVRAVAQGLEDLREEISNQITQEVVNAEVARLRGGAKIERFNFDGTPR
ncbi:MAG: peptidylprolyl isomerase [Rhodospirillales bacterium]|jgi:peptidyl-prolyl cis-trans isomerase C